MYTCPGALIDDVRRAVIVHSTSSLVESTSLDGRLERETKVCPRLYVRKHSKIEPIRGAGARARIYVGTYVNTRYSEHRTMRKGGLQQ